ncbi:MAG: hypothetical protein IJ086_10940 [Clostridium sp.]|nr:hypothetical protein [Clostridium sp.]
MTNYNSHEINNLSFSICNDCPVSSGFDSLQVTYQNLLEENKYLKEKNKSLEQQHQEDVQELSLLKDQLKELQDSKNSLSPELTQKINLYLSKEYHEKLPQERISQDHCDFILPDLLKNKLVETISNNKKLSLKDRNTKLINFLDDFYSLYNNIYNSFQFVKTQNDIYSTIFSNVSQDNQINLNNIFTPLVDTLNAQYQLLLKKEKSQETLGKKLVELNNQYLQCKETVNKLEKNLKKVTINELKEEPIIITTNSPPTSIISNNGIINSPLPLIIDSSNTSVSIKKKERQTIIKNIIETELVNHTSHKKYFIKSLIDNLKKFFLIGRKKSPNPAINFTYRTILRDLVALQESCKYCLLKLDPQRKNSKYYLQK